MLAPMLRANGRELAPLRLVGGCGPETHRRAEKGQRLEKDEWGKPHDAISVVEKCQHQVCSEESEGEGGGERRQEPSTNIVDFIFGPPLGGDAALQIGSGEIGDREAGKH